MHAGGRAADVLLSDATALRVLVQACERVAARQLPGDCPGGAMAPWVAAICDRSMAGTARWTPDIAASMARSLLKLVGQLERERARD